MDESLKNLSDAELLAELNSLDEQRIAIRGEMKAIADEIRMRAVIERHAPQLKGLAPHERARLIEHLSSEGKLPKSLQP